MAVLTYEPVTEADFKDPALFNDKLRKIVEAINGLQGVNGTSQIFGDIDMTGHKIINLGAASAKTDALSQNVADPIYGQKAQQAAMEAVGTKMLQTTRRLNDGTQQHKISSDLNSQGGIPPTIINPMTYTSTTTSITWHWTLLQIKYGDGSVVAVPDGTLLITGLTNSTIYKFYPYYDTLLGQVIFVADNTNAIGVPPVAFPPGATAAALQLAGQSQNTDGRVPLSVGGMSATVGGSGGGGGNQGTRW